MNRQPPVILEGLIARLVPGHCRESIIGDLHERNLSTGQHLIARCGQPFHQVPLLKHIAGLNANNSYDNVICEN
jgi:hypothetical protein